MMTEWIIKSKAIVYIIRVIIWSKGYFVSTVGINEATIRKYVQKQGEEDSGQALLEF